ncbi:MAG: hypothetical protein J2P54_07470 [Bradyrhizobiaceae bacterium]|nr:hypothetical protein [Bradyrhizobiaceae bacterium]
MPKDDGSGARRESTPHQGLRGVARALDQNPTAGFGFIKRSAQHLEYLNRVREWTRGRFALPEQASIVVAEMACAVPGCPPRETVIVFWVDDRRHHIKLFKPVVEVCEEDLPPAWLMPSLAAASDALDCDCC